MECSTLRLNFKVGIFEKQVIGGWYHSGFLKNNPVGVKY